jgi:hypothetical protein
MEIEREKKEGRKAGQDHSRGKKDGEVTLGRKIQIYITLFPTQ